VPDWCHDVIPLAYSAVQRNFWNVGFLRYYSVNQIPNFALTIPIIVLSGSTLSQQYCQDDRDCKMAPAQKQPNFHSLKPHCIHLLCLLGLGLSTMHVQVCMQVVTVIGTHCIVGAYPCCPGIVSCRSAPFLAGHGIGQGPPPSHSRLLSHIRAARHSTALQLLSVDLNEGLGSYSSAR
jgi:hypothetical protein